MGMVYPDLFHQRLIPSDDLIQVLLLQYARQVSGCSNFTIEFYGEHFVSKIAETFIVDSDSYFQSSMKSDIL